MTGFGKRIWGWLTHNSVLKLLSLIFGFLVWLVVVNYSNPKVSDSVTLTYDILNEKSVLSSRQVYSVDTSQVKISYSVRSKYRSQVRSDAFTAYIDLDEVSESGEADVHYEIDSSVAELISDVSISPTKIRITAEKIQQKKFAVRYFLNGSVPDGYAEGRVSISPEYIYVRGPVSVIGKITSVGIEINIDGAVSEVSGTAPAAFYDANGNLLRGIEDRLSFAGDITYSVPVYRVKSLTVNAFTGGAPASGYTVDGVETSPTFISVYGPEDVLNEYSYILIPGSDLNISGITENKTFNLDARNYLPEGLTLKNTNPEITVYVRVRNIHEDTGSKGKTAETQAAAQTQAETAAETAAALEAAGPGAVHAADAESPAEESAAESAEPSAQKEEHTEAGEEHTRAGEESAAAETAGTPENQETAETADDQKPGENGSTADGPSEVTEGFESGPGSGSDTVPQKENSGADAGAGSPRTDS